MLVLGLQKGPKPQVVEPKKKSEKNPKTDVQKLPTLAGYATHWINTVKPIYKDTPEMRTSPLIRTLRMVPAT